MRVRDLNERDGTTTTDQSTRIHSWWHNSAKFLDATTQQLAVSDIFDSCVKNFGCCKENGFQFKPILSFTSEDNRTTDNSYSFYCLAKTSNFVW